MKRNLERAGWLTPCPDDEALLLRQKQRQDLRQWKKQQLQRLAKEFKAEWQEIQKQQVRDLERLYLAHPLGTRGGCAEDSQLVWEEPVQRAATRQQRAREKHRAAIRGLDPTKQPAWHTKSRKKAAGTEKQGAAKVTGVTRPLPSAPDKRKGKQRSSVKTSGGHQHLDPWVRKGTGVDRLYAHPDKTRRSEERGKKETRDGRRQLEKEAASFSQGLKHNRLDSSPEGRWKGLEQLWPVGSTHRGGAVSAGPLGKHEVWKKWQRELEFTFEELVDTNRKLKNRLGRHLEPWLRKGQGPGGEPGCPEVQEPGREAQREKTLEAETVPAREPRDPMRAYQTPSKINLKKLLDKMENQNYRRLAKCVFEEKDKMSKASFKNGDKAPSPKAEVSVTEENWLSCTLESGQEPPETVMLAEGTHQLHPQEHANGGGMMGAVPTPEMERRRQEQLELLEQTGHRKTKLEIVLKAQLEGEDSEQREVRLKPLPAHAQGPEGGQGPSTASPSGVSIIDDSRHGQTLRDLQLQILEQNQLHKQFLEEARKRLQEFQKIC
ncbi:protein DDC8 homolog [Trichechus inunguis]